MTGAQAADLPAGCRLTEAQADGPVRYSCDGGGDHVLGSELPAPGTLLGLAHRRRHNRRPDGTRQRYEARVGEHDVCSWDATTQIIAVPVPDLMTR